MHVNPVVRDSGIGSMHHEYQLQLGTNTPMLHSGAAAEDFAGTLGPHPGAVLPTTSLQSQGLFRSTTLTLVCVF